jgi:hypothetical protein
VISWKKSWSEQYVDMLFEIIKVIKEAREDERRANGVNTSNEVGKGSK